MLIFKINCSNLFLSWKTAIQFDFMHFQISFPLAFMLITFYMHNILQIQSCCVTFRLKKYSHRRARALNKRRKLAVTGYNEILLNRSEGLESRWSSILGAYFYRKQWVNSMKTNQDLIKGYTDWRWKSCNIRLMIFLASPSYSHFICNHQFQSMSKIRESL